MSCLLIICGYLAAVVVFGVGVAMCCMGFHCFSNSYYFSDVGEFGFGVLFLALGMLLCLGTIVACIAPKAGLIL